MQKLLIGTGNQTRLDYVKSMLSELNLDIIGLRDARIAKRAEENGTTALENSLQKAQFYQEISGLATLSIDSGLYIENFPNDQQPGLFVRRIGQNREAASDEEMLAYYIEQLNKTGGDSKGYWEIGITLIKQDSVPLQTTFRRYTKFTTKPTDSKAEGEPLNSIQIDLATGKYLSDLSIEEKIASQVDLVTHIRDFVKNNMQKTGGTIITHRTINLPEQRYVGIKRIVKFSEHNQTDFLALQKAVLQASIHHIDEHANFMAMDSDFTKQSFSYTPLVPVTSYNDNESYTRFTRDSGEYYAFAVAQKDCGPVWFKHLNQYIKQNNLTVERRDYDLEYYQFDYLERTSQEDFLLEEEVFEILIKKK